MDTTDTGDSGLKYLPLTVDDLFKLNVCYVVPKYQRGYAWAKEEINELLSDLDEAWGSYPDEAYLLGQFIVCNSTEVNRIASLPLTITQLDLIDGQQRVTTLFAFMAIAINRLKSLVSEGKLSLERHEEKLISNWENPLTIVGKDEGIYSQVKPAQDGQVIFDALLSEVDMPTPVTSPTQQKLIDAIGYIEDFLDKHDPMEIFNFTAFVRSKVFLVEVKLRTADHALRVFQKVNNRGLELDDADLIKSYLFQSVKSDDDWRTVAENWQNATQKLMGANKKNLKMMETLMKLLIGIKTGKYVSKGDLYKTWSDVLKNDPNEVKTFARSLEGSARDLVEISKSRRPQDGHPTDLVFGALDAGFIQPIEVLLAGAHLETEAYDTLLKVVEDRSMLNSWSKEKNNDFEPIIHPWASNVSKLDRRASREDVLHASARALENFDDLQQRAFLGITALRYTTDSHKKRMRYVLARANNALMKQFGLQTFTISELMRTKNPLTDGQGFDLDHVFPKSFEKADYWDSDASKDQDFGLASRYQGSVNSIGNLILLHPDDNMNQSDELPWSDVKIQSLATSQLVLNTALVSEDLLARGNSVANKARAEARTMGAPQISQGVWGEKEIDRLAKFYWALILRDIRSNFGIKIS